MVVVSAVGLCGRRSGRQYENELSSLTLPQTFPSTLHHVLEKSTQQLLCKMR